MSLPLFSLLFLTPLSLSWLSRARVRHNCYPVFPLWHHRTSKRYLILSQCAYEGIPLGWKDLKKTQGKHWKWENGRRTLSLSCVIKVGAQSVGKMTTSLDPSVRPCPLQSSVALGRCSRREAKSPKPEVMSPAVDPREPAVTFTRKLELFLAAVGLQKLLLWPDITGERNEKKKEHIRLCSNSPHTAFT